MHPLTALDLVDLGFFETERTAQAWFTKRKQTVKHAGYLKEGTGKRSVYLNGWEIRKNNERHEHELTKACLLYYGDCVQNRGPFVDKRLADAEWLFPEYECYVEMFCGTQDRPKWNKRKRAYRNSTRDIRVIVSAKYGKDDEWVERLKAWSEDIYDRFYITTLQKLIDEGPYAFVWETYDLEHEEWVENRIDPPAPAAAPAGEAVPE